jgi:RND family efflux transporter MFP subunit
MPISDMRITTLVAGFLVTLSGCGNKPVPVSTGTPITIPNMVVMPVRMPVERIVDGTIEAVNQATVSAQTSGRVAEILYDVNDVVPAGAVIIRLKGTEQRAGFQGAEAAVTEANARLAEATTSFQRISGLYQQRVVSKAQLDQATANRDAAVARLSAAQAGLATAREGLGYTEIRAPYGGVVTKRLVEVGETVSPGTPLMTGLSLRDLRVNTNVPQSIVMQVRRLKQAAVYLGNQRTAATKITIFPEAATPSSTFRARLDLPPGALDLSPGMYVKVGLVIGEAEQILVPASAVIERGEVTGIYTIDSKGQIFLRYVRLGHRSGDKVEILTGVSAGERIALDPIAASAQVSAQGHRS